jgi:hypothetical protein
MGAGSRAAATGRRCSLAVCGSVAACVLGVSCATYSASGADGDAGQGDGGQGDAGADGTAGEADSVTPVSGCFDAGPDDGAAFIVSEDFRASGCDGWAPNGTGFTVDQVDAGCGVSACEICAATPDAGGQVGLYYPTPTFDGGSYTVSGWLADHDAGPAATYALAANFLTPGNVSTADPKANGGLTAEWAFATSAATTINPPVTQVQVGIYPLNMQAGGCLRITHVRVAKAQ